MNIDHPSLEVLRFQASRENAQILTGVLFVLILAWEWLVYGRPLTPAAFRNPGGAFREEVGNEIYWLMVLLPAPLLILMVKFLLVAMLGREIVFDAGRQAVLKNGRVQATVAEIESIELRLWDDGNIRARLLLREGRPVKLGVLCSEEQLGDVLGELRGFGRLTGNLSRLKSERAPPDP